MNTVNKQPITFVRRKGEQRSIVLQPGLDLNKPLHKYVNWRMYSQIFFLAVYVFAPLLNILRLDLAQKKLILVGQSVSVWWIAPIACVVLGGLGILYVWLASHYGRVFCSSACMQGTMVELSNKLYMQLLGRTRLTASARKRKTSHFRTQRNRFLSLSAAKQLWLKFEALIVVVGLPALVALSSLTWLVDPAQIWREVVTWNFEPIHAGAFITMTFLGIVNFLWVKDGFCRYLCYVNIMQQFAGQSMNLKGAGPTQNFAQDCIQCNACVDVCYMNEDPRYRRPFQFLERIDACVACGECVVECEAEMGRVGKPPVLQMSVLAGPESPLVDYRLLNRELRAKQEDKALKS